MTLEDHQKLSNDELYRIIARLKAERNAMFLVHNYQILEVQRVADHIGDSLALAQAAVKVDARVIVFCGVHFMAESAKILNPSKKVIMPDRNAGCPMADMVTAESLIAAKRRNGNPAVVAYINTAAAVKAESDICCTSSNAVKIVKSIPVDQKILFVPDKNLGSYAAKMSGRELILWPGHCFVHNRLTVEDVETARDEHPGARLIVHPECPSELAALADEVASTSGMVKAVKENPNVNEWIIGTETGLVDQLSNAYPQKGIYPLSRRAVCNNMKMTTLAKVAWALEHEEGEITVPEDIAIRAKKALDRMLEIS
ncbi:MAG: quinolinate synthase NadA [Candidatus Edwardsbacteria bacterium]|nr:quinolinate synthase NadA [Candidatus Edwardsbacteria bacterium]